MTFHDTPRRPPSISCSLLQGATGALIWLVIGSFDPPSPATGTSALQAATAFLILVACGAPGALGISMVQAMLMAKALSPIAILLHAAAPGTGAYLGFAVTQRSLHIGPHLAGLRQHQIPLLVLATALSTASLYAVAASTTGQHTSSTALVKLALTNFVAIMLVMVTLLITIRAARALFIAR